MSQDVSDVTDPENAYTAAMTYADFEEVGDVSRAKSFITAATRYLIANPQSQSDQSSSLTASVSQIHELLIRAREFVRVKGTARSSGGSKVLTVSPEFRG